MSNSPSNAAPPPSPPVGRVVVSCLALGAVMLLALPLFAWFGWNQHGGMGVWSAATACGICFGGALLALLVTGIAGTGPHAVNALLLGMLFRMGIPLVAGFLLEVQKGPLAKAGVMEMLLFFFLIALAAETLLSLYVLGRFQRSARGSQISQASNHAQ